MSEENRIAFLDCIARFPQQANPIRAAYEQLIDGGYPWPGSWEADSEITYLDASEDVLMVRFSMSKSLITMVMDDPDYRLEEVHLLGRECRRMDYMVPRVAYMISPTWDVIRTVVDD